MKEPLRVRIVLWHETLKEQKNGEERGKNVFVNERTPSTFTRLGFVSINVLKVSIFT